MQEAEVERFRAGMTVFTSRAIDAMKGGKPGDFISIEEMERIVGRPCGNRDQGRGNVASARRLVLKENRVVWEWDRSRKGWRCLSDDEKPDVMRARTRRARNQIRRGLAVISTADLNSLSESQRNVIRTQTIQAGTVLLFSSDKSFKKMQESGIELKKITVSDKVLELMKRKT